MELLHAHCAGLDVHRDTVVACVRVASDGQITHQIETFSTMTPGLLALSDWLSQHHVTHVAMEATGVYWKPVWHLLSNDFELVLANARDVKNVPGRKTDVKDAAWLADLMAHGLIRSSFVPPSPIQDLRSLTRTRKQLVRERASHVQRIDKTLQDANLKLGTVLTDIMGMSGRAIIESLIAGLTDPRLLIERLHNNVKAPRGRILDALQGTITDNHRFLLKLHLRQIDELDKSIADIDSEVGARLAPFRSATERLSQIPGIGDVAAAAILAEIGVDMSRFPSAGHLVSWAGLCPRNDESAGKRRSTRLRKSGSWLKPLLVQCAWSATRKKGSYFQAQFLRLRARRGARKAIVAVAASLITTIYAMLSRNQDYKDLGAQHFHRADRQKLANRLIRKLGELGFQVDDLRTQVPA
jgi:transposase